MAEFVTRLLIRVEAENERDAVDQFIENTNKFGLRSWVYVVENALTKDLYRVTGSGDSEKIDPATFISNQ